MKTAFRLQYGNGTKSQTQRKETEICGGWREGGKEKPVAICEKGEHGETGCADKEAAPLRQATYLLQKATGTQELGARTALKKIN